MAGSTRNQQLKNLEAENKRLRQDNLELRKRLNGKAPPKGRGVNVIRKIAAILCVALAVALLFTGNILFWTGNTVVKTDKYVAATAPIIRNPAVQDALAYNINQKLYNNVDIDQIISGALPPRAAFLAPTIADQVRQHSDQAVKKILQRPQFQDRWNAAQQRAHDRFIRLVGKHGSDGSIDISEVYSDVSQQLQGTKLAFLANKPLPAKVGDIQLVKGGWLTVLNKTIRNIDTWRVIAIILLVVFSVAGVWLSRNRRKTVEALGWLFAAAMLITVIALKLIRESIGNRVDPHYSEAAKQTFSIVTHSLRIQTFTLLFAALVMVVIAWVSGGSPAARATRSRVDQLFSGNLHKAIFSRGENGFTRWLGAYKSILQWLTVALVAASVLFISLTPAVLLIQVIIILIVVLLIEIFAAP